MSCGPQVFVGSGGYDVVQVATQGPLGPPGPAGSASFTTPVLTANLPTPVAGSRSIVSDAQSLTFGAAVVGGGTQVAPVWATNSAWLIG